PTLSGLHDLGRVADVARHFGIPAMVCINKWDINPDVASQIEQEAISRGLTLAGRVRYDSAVTAAQIQKRSVVEHKIDGCAQDIRAVWERINTILFGQKAP
ncbi:(4Fe-4S)-binding protein, partial [Candidatus Sumerlaeota bacterium]|nr:(4Fe-4S)-binding protein [Candidatus Sumerlaeota bacterium]